MNLEISYTELSLLRDLLKSKKDEVLKNQFDNFCWTWIGMKRVRTKYSDEEVMQLVEKWWSEEQKFCSDDRTIIKGLESKFEILEKELQKNLGIKFYEY